jgi:hypothetical protein
MIRILGTATTETKGPTSPLEDNFQPGGPV